MDELQRHVEELKALLAASQWRIQELESKLGQNSGDSSPPALTWAASASGVVSRAICWRDGQKSGYLLGGFLMTRHTPSVGTRRFVALPGALGGRAADPGLLGLKLEPDRDPVVLVVDDVPSSLRLLVSVLKERGYQVMTAVDGPGALEAVRGTVPDLVLLDIEMPGMDGYEVCLRLKAEEVTREVPVVFITARTGPEDIVRGFRCGGIDYVVKPFHPLELLARVHTHVTLKRTRDRERELLAALHESQGRVAALGDFLPICAKCQRVKGGGGHWQSLETCLEESHEVRLTRGLCPDCAGLGPA